MTRVLIVDDDPGQLRSLARIFSVRRRDLVVITAGNGREAVALLQAAPVDLVLTDLQMPEMNGFELLSWLLSHQPHVPLFTMTAYPDVESVDRLRELGSIECFTKPLDVPNVLARLSRAITEPGALDELAILPDQPHPSPDPRPTARPAERAECTIRMPTNADALAVVDTESGRVRTASGYCENLDGLAELAAAVLRAKLATVAALRIHDEVRELVLTTPRCWTVIRPVHTHPSAFAMLVFDPNRATLVMERREMDELVHDLEADHEGTGSSAPTPTSELQRAATAGYRKP